MAKAKAASDVNKSQAIRDYLNQNGNVPPKDVVEALGKEGVNVTTGLVSNVKFHMGLGGKRRKKKVAKRVARGRARQGSVNKSAEIRKYMGRHRNAAPKEIIEALAAEGIEVSQGLVSAVKYGKQPTGARRGRGRARAGRPAAAASSLSAQDLIQANELINQMGGVDRVREALDLLEQLS